MVTIPKFSGNLLLGVLGLGALFFITREIRGAGQDLARFGENLKFPEIKLPQIFGQKQPVSAPLTQPGQVGINLATAPTLPTPIDVRLATGLPLGITPSPFDPNLQPGRFVPTGRAFTGLEKDRPIIPIVPGEDISGAEFAAARGQVEFRRRQQVQVQPVQVPQVQSFLESRQQFQIGGVSAIGGTVREIPVSRLSLSQIIDRFNVSASRARDIQFRARGEIPSGFIPKGFTLAGGERGRTFLPSTGSISDPRFRGLSAIQIRDILISGNTTGFA